MEKEEENKVFFLDALITQAENGITTSVYNVNTQRTIPELQMAPSIQCQRKEWFAA